MVLCLSHAMMRHFPNVEKSKNVREMPFVVENVEIVMYCCKLCLILLSGNHCRTSGDRSN